MAGMFPPAPRATRKVFSPTMTQMMVQISLLQLLQPSTTTTVNTRPQLEAGLTSPPSGDEANDDETRSQPQRRVSQGASRMGRKGGEGKGEGEPRIQKGGSQQGPAQGRAAPGQSIWRATQEECTSQRRFSDINQALTPTPTTIQFAPRASPLTHGLT
ncbi:uncharacterized protein GGS22DRAFT_119340 [Annulohypoxylon maeteangense]|uniref:uncharacterized protein n=1 Tax=Annulohypoxylon maeteangense TaxID=1927788 RepID=UPI002008817A|nr:uncharacterized protein GGS22DRAFT_119340 [Annulohypoxylon maeteangense]KAI0886942.1 hypothetical protein GGS22DRAFT_119340 [Annulohypoxylon maeteangense]